MPKLRSEGRKIVRDCSSYVFLNDEAILFASLLKLLQIAFATHCFVLEIVHLAQIKTPYPSFALWVAKTALLRQKLDKTVLHSQPLRIHYKHDFNF